MPFLTGQMVDGPQNGPSPPPWEIQVPYPQKYTDVVMKAQVPHSSVVKVWVTSSFVFFIIWAITLISCGDQLAQ